MEWWSVGVTDFEMQYSNTPPLHYSLRATLRNHRGLTKVGCVMRKAWNI
jgi:hypothetical protein